MGEAGPRMKVIELGIQNDVFKYLRDKLSPEEMEKKFKKRDIKITSQSIRKFITKSQEEQQNMIKRDLGAVTEYKKMWMDYNKAIKDILTEVEEVKNNAKNDRDYSAYTALVGRLLQGIDLFAKIAGDLKIGGSGDINIIFNEISRDVERDKSKTINEIFKDDIIDVDAIIERQKSDAVKNDTGEVDE